MTLFRIRPLDRAVDVSAFQCGQPPLDDYIRRYAAQDERRGIGRVFVATPSVTSSATPDADGRRLAGYFSLSAGSVRTGDLPPGLARRLPRYPVPVALLGRLAVDLDFQGQGLGAILLADACRKVLHASHTIGVVAVVVDAKDAPAAAFYRHFGFTALPGEAHRLLLPIPVVQKLFAPGTPS